MPPNPPDLPPPKPRDLPTEPPDLPPVDGRVWEPKPPSRPGACSGEPTPSLAVGRETCGGALGLDGEPIGLDAGRETGPIDPAKMRVDPANMLPPNTNAGAKV
jgi:hypothetical protein